MRKGTHFLIDVTAFTVIRGLPLSSTRKLYRVFAMQECSRRDAFS